MLLQWLLRSKNSGLTGLVYRLSRGPYPPGRNNLDRKGLRQRWSPKHPARTTRLGSGLYSGAAMRLNRVGRIVRNATQYDPL